MKIFDLSSYSLCETLPAGGLTHAYVATRHGTERVLVKRLHHGYASKPEIRARWLEQVAFAAACSHPASIRVLDYGSVDEDAYMALEFIEGVSLMTVVRGLRATQERLSIDASIHIARVFLDVLAHLHAQQTASLHYDVSTRAVRIVTDGTVRISEGATWGTFTPREALRERFERGTAVYQSPEQINALEPDPRSELFSLGVMLFELLAAERPFQGGSQLAVALAIGEGTRKKLREVAPAVPQALCNIVERLLAHKPEDRFQSAGDAYKTLAAFPVVDVGAELAGFVARFQANDALPPVKPGLPPAAVASARPDPHQKLSVSSDEPRTRLGWAVPPTLREPPPAHAEPLEERRDEPRTELIHGQRALAASRVAAVQDTPPDEPRTRLDVPIMTTASAHAPRPSSARAEPQTRMQGSLDLPLHPNTAPPRALGTASQPSAASKSTAPASEAVFGGAAGEPAVTSHRSPEPVHQVPAPPPEVPRPPLHAHSSALVPPPALGEVPAPPLLLNLSSAVAEPVSVAAPVAPTAPSRVQSASPSAPARPEAMEPSAPMVSDGKTAFLDRKALRAGASSPAPEPRTKAPTPVPALIAVASEPPPAVQPRERGLPELVSPVQMPASLGPSSADRRWKDPSHTLFRAKVYAKDPTRREEARVPMSLLVTLSLVFGFALVAGGYFLFRLFN